MPTAAQLHCNEWLHANARMRYNTASPADARHCMTPLDKPLRRALHLGEQVYTLVIDPHGLKLVEKGRRKGVSLRWDELVSGDAAVARALQASLEDR